MASYGYGFGSSQSQGYSNVHPQSSYTAQASSAYGGSYGGTAAAAPRQMVPQSYDANAGYGYGYGRQQDTQSSSIPSSHQTTYGSSSYMSRDGGGYDASKSSYGYGSSSQGMPIHDSGNCSRNPAFLLLGNLPRRWLGQVCQLLFALLAIQFNFCNFEVVFPSLRTWL